MLAPIIIFAFNRLEPLKKTINSLLENPEATESDLFIFVDGPRSHKVGEEQKVASVQEYIKSIKGFKNIEYYFSEINKGLGNSIIAGVSQIIHKYGQAIILEDDLTFSKNFLSFMNQGLSKYQKEDKVFSICGYSNQVHKPQNYNSDTYFCTRSSSWGWATWKDRWETIDWQLKNWEDIRKHKSGFNKWGGSDCFKMLEDWYNGKNQSWAIRFCFNQYLQQKLSLFPIISKVNNNGFDGEGTNCKKWSRFKCHFDTENKTSFSFPKEIELNKKLFHSAMRYNSLMIRAWSKLMYIIYR